jgi:hypothetical protein
MERPDRAARLAPAHHLYEAADGVWRLCAPSDRFTKIRAPGRLLARLQRVLHGLAPLDDALEGCDGDDRDVIVALLDGFERRGLLAADAQTPGPPAGRTVHVEGDTPVAACVVDLLEPQVTVSRGPLEGAVGEADMLVACAHWLPDARWVQIDRLCTERMVPWHMCYAEGDLLYVGPFSLPGRTASYADTRARRLAAAGAPDELESYWSYLDRGHDLPPVPWPSAGGCALVAGIIVADVLGHLCGDAVPSEGYQLGIDPRRALVGRHPVLALPSLDGGPAGAGGGGEPRPLSSRA